LNQATHECGVLGSNILTETKFNIPHCRGDHDIACQRHSHCLHYILAVLLIDLAQTRKISLVFSIEVHNELSLSRNESYLYIEVPRINFMIAVLQGFPLLWETYAAPEQIRCTSPAAVVDISGLVVVFRSISSCWIVVFLAQVKERYMIKART
jgi:hypothetical protein